MNLRSSYIANDFGGILWSYVVNMRLMGCVELGILDGYSTIHIARGIRDIKNLYGLESFFHAYDLFDEYPYKHGSLEEVKKAVSQSGLTDYVEIKKGDAYQVHQFYAQKSIELLHVDISNTGTTIRQILDLWHPLIADKGIICFEGGSEERDNMDWMVKYKHPSIKEEISANPVLNKYYIYGTYFMFPSMTVCMRKWWDVDKKK